MFERDEGQVSEELKDISFTDSIIADFSKRLVNDEKPFSQMMESYYLPFHHQLPQVFIVTPKFLCGNGFPKQVKYNETLTSNYPLLPFFPSFPLVLAPVPMLTTCLSAPSVLFFLPFFSH